MSGRSIIVNSYIIYEYKITTKMSLVCTDENLFIQRFKFSEM